MKYIVSSEHQFIYFVNQKVACSSIKEALFPLFPIPREPYSFVNHRGVRRLRVHRAFDESEHQLTREQLLEAFNAGEFAGYFKFGFVRNPWDRLVSCFLQKIDSRQKGETSTGAPLRQPEGRPRAFRLGMSFVDFVQAVSETPDDESDQHFKSQHLTFYDGDTCMADFIGRFERLQEDFATATRRIGLAQIELPHVLKSRNPTRRTYPDFYDDYTRQLVEQRFARDVEVFGYSFDG